MNYLVGKKFSWDLILQLINDKIAIFSLFNRNEKISIYNMAINGKKYLMYVNRNDLIIFKMEEVKEE